MSNQSNIAAVQAEIEQALEALPGFARQLPPELKSLERLAPNRGFRVQVSLRHGDEKKSRQVKSNAPADSWSAESDDIIFISYDVSTDESPAPTRQVNAPAIQPARPEIKLPQGSDPERDLLRTLAKAEGLTPFVSLKWFRDTFLLQQGFAWAVTPEERHRVLASAIERRWILTSKVANPKNPSFPVTAIRANQPLTEVREILDRDASMRSAFSPVVITGEPLSQTVLRDRR
jgi:hypothetical protein